MLLNFLDKKWIIFFIFFANYLEKQSMNLLKIMKIYSIKRRRDQTNL
ncbi:hypothetical protein MPTP_1634 [Melissococcus plutonius ATCC 35311]|uniref:Uncharacterized protein n=2 Tax=Melissococcus plutonius TaxID=33970 RepID=F3YC33_MELPT|nr:hypothetical protein MPTP_1634 [Melissococcus plutonius ATCC 35311]BAL61694.1 hypothetical protein MPD5_0420 [Melissococcus plutonius DAT561]BBC60557.1 hypothetical protein DAT561_0420 [Melissococcus plutonius]BBD15791.1 hypothetical protein DAT585_1512 [Melissococcus plutonius]BBD17238.1 hypothetical protein DAT606_1275 [Melissococcus plutonius]